jgi:hypothetical protein
MISDILEGWANKIKDKFGLLEPELKIKSEKRLLICDTCPIRNNDTCSKKRTGEVVESFTYLVKKEDRVKGQIVKGCGCSLSAKSMCENCQCPLGKWIKI